MPWYQGPGRVAEVWLLTIEACRFEGNWSFVVGDKFASEHFHCTAERANIIMKVEGSAEVCRTYCRRPLTVAKILKGKKY